MDETAPYAYYEDINWGLLRLWGDRRGLDRSRRVDHEADERDTAHDGRALGPAHEEWLVQPDGAHRPNRRVDSAGDELERAAIELAARRQSHSASSLVQ